MNNMPFYLRLFEHNSVYLKMTNIMRSVEMNIVAMCVCFVW